MAPASPPLPPPLETSDGAPVGARLALHHQRWRDQFPQATWLLQLVTEGLHLSFDSPPPLTRHPRPIQLPQDPMKAAALLSEVHSLLKKEAIVQVRDVFSLGFYSHLFLVPKPGGRWRPIIDLSALNTFLRPPYFKMETARSIRMSIQPGDWAISLDLTDAYLHIPIHINSQRYLRFAVEETVYMFRALPFGLSLSPWIFTRVMNAIMTSARCQTSSTMAAYLDDILVKHPQRQVLEQDRDFLLGFLQKLGFIVSKEKSDLRPKQCFDHLGMNFDSRTYTVGLTAKRIDSLWAAAQEVLGVSLITRRGIARMVGLCQAAAELLPLGRLRLRPLQWAVTRWFSPAAPWDIMVPMEQSFQQALEPWTDLAWLQLRVPIRPPVPTQSICTDASLEGWGAHLLPDFIVASGMWTQEEQARHINELEMLAVLRALQEWTAVLERASVLILSDNSTVVAYISKQGGTRSERLCQLSTIIWQFAQLHSIDLQARHIPGRLNVLADGLSRRRVFATEWTLAPAAFQWLLERFPHMTCDLFATRFNSQLMRFVSPFPDPTAVAVDALSAAWEDSDVYAFPPTPLIPRVLTKLENFAGEMTLVAPLAPHRAWFSMLLDRLLQVPLRIPVTPDLLRQPLSGDLMEDPASLHLHACRLYGGPLRPRDFQVRRWSESLAVGVNPP